MRTPKRLLVCLVALAVAAPREAKDKPNFVMFFVDDLGYGDVGFTGHPTTRTPNIDRLAAGGKVLTTWYSGCPICTGSRAALMTGRQYTRTGVPGVFSNNVQVGLPRNETTIAEMLKQQDYATAAVGKWHLGQRQVYLPGNRGFDYYLGIPFSDDMGQARATSCTTGAGIRAENGTENAGAEDGTIDFLASYRSRGDMLPGDEGGYSSDDDPGAKLLPLVYQEGDKTKVLEQPLDFTHLAEKYSNFAVDFIHKHKETPFFLYIPFSHVHATAANQPGMQYAGCPFKNKTSRGSFGDALAEVDWMIGNVHQAVVDAGVEENTLLLFSSDNGPWLYRGLAAGSAGLFCGRYAGYWNTGKGSTWEGGIREPAFAYWKGQIEPFTRSEEVVSSMDVFPTLAALANVALPSSRVLDGRDISKVLLENGPSPHEFLFFYGGCMSKSGSNPGPAAVRYGKWKAHWCTGPGIAPPGDPVRHYKPWHPLLFEINVDPSEAEPLNPDGGQPKDPEAQQALKDIHAAYIQERDTFTPGKLVPEPDGPGEGPGRYAICCDRAKACDCNGSPSEEFQGEPFTRQISI